MNAVLKNRLSSFTIENKFKGKGPLGVALIVTQHARKKGLPLNADELVTGSGAQVAGLGGPAVHRILKRHGVERPLGSEIGRTSRGSIARMRQYVALLNDLHAQGIADLDEIEAFWIERVYEYFAGKPFRIALDASKSLRNVIGDVIAQAEERQRTSQGTYYAGAVLQYLVGAKLECALGEGQFEHHSFSTSDAQSGRAGDFVIGDVAIHVTTSPGEAVIDRCKQNLNDGLRPVIVTTQRGVALAVGLAENKQLHERIDVFEVEQFVALNLYELGRFVSQGRQTAVADLIERYNAIVERVETDPSLRIEIRR
jgi:hypothetical protein